MFVSLPCLLQTGNCSDCPNDRCGTDVPESLYACIDRVSVVMTLANFSSRLIFLIRSLFRWESGNGPKFSCLVIVLLVVVSNLSFFGSSLFPCWNNSMYGVPSLFLMMSSSGVGTFSIGGNSGHSFGSICVAIVFVSYIPIAGLERLAISFPI